MSEQDRIDALVRDFQESHRSADVEFGDELYEYRIVSSGGAYTYGFPIGQMTREQAEAALAENLRRSESDRGFRGSRITDEFQRSIHIERRAVGTWVRYDPKPADPSPVPPGAGETHPLDEPGAHKENNAS